MRNKLNLLKLAGQSPAFVEAITCISPSKKGLFKKIIFACDVRNSSMALSLGWCSILPSFMLVCPVVLEE